jgi:hypothetical protein
LVGLDEKIGYIEEELKTFELASKGETFYICLFVRIDAYLHVHASDTLNSLDEKVGFIEEKLKTFGLASKGDKCISKFMHMYVYCAFTYV